MALTLPAAAQTQINLPAYGVHWLVEADFTGGTVYLTTAPIDVVSGSTYTGMGKLLAISDVTESSDISAAKVTLGLTLTDTSQVASLLGSIDTYRGRAIRLYLQVFDEKFVPAGTKILRWSGYMNPVKISVTGGKPGKVEMVCTRAGMTRLRNYQGLRMTHQQQIQRFPGDLGLQYMADLIEKPALWLSKKFQELD